MRRLVSANLTCRSQLNVLKEASDENPAQNNVLLDVCFSFFKYFAA